jgi:hypothetical protein
MALGCTGGIFLLPVLQVLAMLLSGLVQCLLLRIWGIHHPDISLKQDIRAWIYVFGFLGMAAWTPLGPVAMLGVMIVAGMGYAKIHRVPAWKGVAATITHLGVVLAVTLGSFILFVVLMASKTARINPSKVRGQGIPSLQVLPGMSPESILTLHQDQARVTLNSLARTGTTPEKAVEQALKDLPNAYQFSKNPYDPDKSAFCSGAPVSMGQVGLLPLHDFNDPVTSYRFKAGILVEAWTKEGRIRRYVTFN